MPGALDGITVVEFASNLSAAYAAMLLAEQGARVVLAIRAEHGSHIAALQRRVFDRGKQAETLDLAAPAGRHRRDDLIAGADLVITGDTPARCRELGLDYESIRRRNRAAVGLYLPPFGSVAPLADLEGGEELAAALSGVTGSQWARSGDPVATIFPVVSYATGVLGAIAGVAALIARDRAGRGQAVEVPMIAGGLALQTGGVLRHPAMRPLHPTEGSQNPFGPIPCYRIFEAADGRYLFIACGNPTFWNRFTIAIDRPELVADPRFESAPWGLTTENRDALREILEPIVRSRQRAAWLEILREHDVPCAPVATRAEFFAAPQVRYMDARREVRDALLGPTVQVGSTIRLSATPGGIAHGDGNRASASIANDNPTGLHTISADAPPLEGIVVLDFSSYIAGSFCGMLLAQLGAEVVKVESPQGDSFRSMEFAFMGWNQGKRSIALDLTRAEGRELAQRLAERGDVVLENMRAGRMHRFGLDYESLAAKNRRLIYMTITGYGSRGPEYNQPGFDPLLQARSGMMAAQGGPHGAPVYLTCSPCDYGAAMLATLGIVLALRARSRDGRGQFCETSLLQAATAFQAGELLFYDGRSDEPENGSAEYRGPSALSRAYRAGDGLWLFVSIGDEAGWARLRGLLGIESHSDFASASREPAEGALAARLAERFAADDREALLARLRTARIPAVAVNRVNDLFSDPQLAANDLLVDLEHPARGPVTQTGLMMKFAATPGVLRRPAPLLGQHADAILGELLGLDELAMNELRRQGVLGK